MWIASLASAGGLLWWVSGRVSLWPAELTIARPDYLAAAIALHIPYSLARSVRLGYALAPQARLSRAVVYGSGLVSACVILLLPLRLGELSRPLFVAKLSKRLGLPEVVAAVASERLVDGLMVVGLLLLGISLAVPATSQSVEVAALAQSMGAVFLTGLFGLVVFALIPSEVLAERLAPLPAPLARSLTNAAKTLRSLAQTNVGGPLLAWSVVYWGLTVLQAWLLLQACGLPVGLAAAAVVVGVVGLSIQLPGGPAQLGSHQVGSVVALGLVVPDTSLGPAGDSFVAVSYVLSLAGALVLAGPGLWLMARARSET